MLPPLLMEILDTGKTMTADGRVVGLHSNVSRAEAEALNRLVEEIRPAVAIEIGCAQGISALAIGAAAREHHVIDPYQSEAPYLGAGFANVQRAGLSTICHEDFPENVVPSLPATQFAFIDASHLFDLSVLDFVLIDKRLEVGGVIGFHDMWMPSLRKLLRYILTNRAYELVTPDPKPASRRVRALRAIPRVGRLLKPELLRSLPEMGVRDNLVFVRKLADDTREWTYHREF